MNVYKVIIIIIITIIISPTESLAQKPPMGEWILLTSQGEKYDRIIVQNSEKTLRTITSFGMSKELDKAKPAPNRDTTNYNVVEVITSKTSDNKGLILLKKQSENPYYSYMFYYIIDQSQVVFTLVLGRFSEREALDKEMEKLQNDMGLNGYKYFVSDIFLSKSKYEQFFRLPTAQNIDKEACLAFLNLLIQKLKSQKETSSSLDLSPTLMMTYVIRDFLVQKNYNPFLSFPILQKALSKFSNEAEVQEKGRVLMQLMEK